MVKLTYKKRKSLPSSDFAVIQTEKSKKTGKSKKVRRFPINDKAHARNALARLPQAKGLDQEEKDAIKKKAKRKLYGKTNTTKRAK